ncbi:MAG: MATE family efflux transporter [Lachnospiraceae bacterium]|nr:MATE family efflux transporter [Candidatus Colinaster scatohippi]
MTKEPVGLLILKLGIPTTITMLVTNLYNMADTYYVSKLGTSASGATGVVFGLMALLQACGFMFGQGAGSIISRKLGAKDDKSASEYATVGFAAALLVGIGFLIIGMILITPLMRLFGSTDTIMPYARVYGRCILVAAPAMIISCLLNNILRYEGKAILAMIGLVSGSVLNIFLDALFVVVIQTGIIGAGIATAVSQYISFFILLMMFLTGKTQSRILFSELFVNRIALLKEIVLIGLPSMIRQGLGCISVMVLNNSAMIYGDAAIAAMSIVARVINFLFSVGLGIGQGYQPVAGYGFGAGKYSRVKKGFIFTWIFGTALLGSFAMFALFKSDQVVAVFRDDPEVVSIGTLAMKWQCISLIFIPFTVCNNMMFQCTGKSMIASFLSSLRSGACFIPIILILSRIYGLTGIQVSQAIADIIAALICIPFTIRYFKELPQDVPDGPRLLRQVEELNGKSNKIK